MSIKAASKFDGNGASLGQNKVEGKLKENPEAAKTSEPQFRAISEPQFF
jgi:hypothetical protein